MFELPEDDEDFWEDLPLDDITNSNIQSRSSPKAKIPVASNQPKCQLRQTSDAAVIQTSSKPDLPDIDLLDANPVHDAGPRKRLSSGSSAESVKKICREDISGERNFSIQQCLDGSNQTRQPKTSLSSSNQLSIQSQGVTKTPVIKKAKRKFPGPAGLLPKLSPGVIQAGEGTPICTKRSPEEIPVQKEEVILSSQSGEDVFNDVPWKSLISDLGPEGQQYLKNFSIATSLSKARRKQLPRGKIPLILCVVESFEWEGSDCSVTIKDQSGKIQGTIHRDIMKEHDNDLQVGVALVLRQVSVISPNPRNHYLNITPANIVLMYTKEEGSTMQISKRDATLPRVLKEVEEETTYEKSQRVNTTMRTVNNQCTPIRTPYNPSQLNHGGMNAPVRHIGNQDTPFRTQYNSNQLQNKALNGSVGNITQIRQQVTYQNTPNRTQINNQNTPIRSQINNQNTHIRNQNTPMGHQKSYQSKPIRHQMNIQNRPMGQQISGSTFHSVNLPHGGSPTIPLRNHIKTTSMYNSNVTQQSGYNSNVVKQSGDNQKSSMFVIGKSDSSCTSLLQIPSDLGQCNMLQRTTYTGSNCQSTPNRRSFKFKTTKTPEICKNSCNDLTRCDLQSDRMSCLNSVSSFKQDSNPSPASNKETSTGNNVKPNSLFVVDWEEDLSDEMLSQLSEEF